MWRQPRLGEVGDSLRDATTTKGRVVARYHYGGSSPEGLDKGPVATLRLRNQGVACPPGPQYLFAAQLQLTVASRVGSDQTSIYR